jgi:DeoR/GlpR family transcriptional regulator of sugar metabolism
MKAQRHQHILEILRAEGAADVKRLSAMLAVSQATVRRDLDRLARESLIERRHGGALAIDGSAFVEPSVHSRANLQVAAKRAIGRAAAGLIEDGDTVFLSGGTTTYEVARSLTTRRGLTVITPAINIIGFLANHPEVTVIVPGGVLVHRHLSLVGHIARCALDELRADKVVMGVAALSLEHGITAEKLDDAETDRMVMGLTPNRIVVADSSKFGLVAPAWVAPLSDVRHVVTDVGVGSPEVVALSALGVDVIVATAEEREV